MLKLEEANVSPACITKVETALVDLCREEFKGFTQHDPMFLIFGKVERRIGIYEIISCLRKTESKVVGSILHYYHTTSGDKGPINS